MKVLLETIYWQQVVDYKVIFQPDLQFANVSSYIMINHLKIAFPHIPIVSSKKLSEL